MATLTVGDTTFTVDATAVLLSSSSHPILGLQEVQIQATEPIPEGVSVARAATVDALSGTAKAGVAAHINKDKRTFRAK